MGYKKHDKKYRNYKLMQYFCVVKINVTLMIIKDTIIQARDLSPADYRRFLREVHDNESYVKIKNGLYASLDVLANDWVDIDKIIPGGILCHYSAWHFYGMTTQVPDSFHIAIDRNRKVKLPYMPDITLVYQSSNILELGVQTVLADDFSIRIYDRERSVCDAVKYRNKIGIDVMSEILNTYLKYEGRNLDRLLKYAATLRVQSILKRYLEIML